MRSVILSVLAIGLAGLLVGQSCVSSPTNQSPVADAGQDMYVSVGAQVNLDASASTDPDGDTLSFSWAQTSGPAVELQNANQAVVSFVASTEGDYEFTVTVDDGAGGSNSDTVVVHAGAGCSDRTSPQSSFESDADGWRVEGGPFTVPTSPVWSQEGGIPGGEVSATGSEDWYWLAPAKFLGNACGAYGRTLKFDLNQSRVSGPNANRLVVLEGGGQSIYIDGTYTPTQTWTNYMVRLDETALWYDSDTDQRVTQTQMQLVLSNLSTLKIRGWCQNGTLGPVEGTGGLDNVVLDLEGIVIPTLTGASVVSNFETNAEGWTVAGGSLGRSGGVSRSATGGVPGGQVSATGKDPWYWMAPPKFLGNALAAYGRTLEFDLNQSLSSGPNAQQLVILEGGGYSIYVDGTYQPGVVWSNYSFKLDETELWRDADTGQRVTKAQIQAVLSRLSQLKIRGWCQNGTLGPVEGTGGLDNVILNLAGGPSALSGSSVSSNFGADADGWIVAGGSLGRSGAVAWNVLGGNTGGNVSATGEERWYWLAPPKFLGNALAAYGRTLKFDLKQSLSSGPNAQRLVVLQGGGHSIYIDGTSTPGTVWTSFTFTLDETALWRDSDTEERATQAQFQAILSDLSQLQIRGWCQQGTMGPVEGTGSLDNVVLELAD